MTNSELIALLLKMPANKEVCIQYYDSEWDCYRIEETCRVIDDVDYIIISTTDSEN